MIDTHLEYNRLIEAGHDQQEAEAIIEGLRGVSGENISYIRDLNIKFDKAMGKINENMIMFAAVRRDVHFTLLGIGAGFTIVIGMIGFLFK